MANNEVFAPKVFDDEQHMVDTARAFVHGKVMPLAERIIAQKPGLMRSLVEKAGALSLLSADMPEEYGGLGTGPTVSTILADYLAVGRDRPCQGRSLPAQHDRLGSPGARDARSALSHVSTRC
jgi:hypothetical protein